jgi:hypothetical protein
LITRCDTKQQFLLNLDDREYTTAPLRVYGSLEEWRLAHAVPQVQVVERREPTVLVETETVDTGERKDFFGHLGRHVITTRRIVPLAGAKWGPSTTVTDGWYIDLDRRVSCDPSWRFGRSGHGLLSLIVKGEPSDAPMFRDIGEPETGLAVLSRTLPETMTPQDGAAQTPSSIWQTEVTDVSTAEIDSALFEVPADFRLVERVRQDPIPPLSVRSKHVYEHVVRRVRAVNERLRGRADGSDK